MPKPSIRRQDPYLPLSKEAFRERFFARFYDPEFEQVAAELERVFEVAWDGYHGYRKSPRTRKAGPGFADPDFELPIEWADHEDVAMALYVKFGSDFRRSQRF